MSAMHGVPYTPQCAHSYKPALCKRNTCIHCCARSNIAVRIPILLCAFQYCCAHSNIAVRIPMARRHCVQLHRAVCLSALTQLALPEFHTHAIITIIIIKIINNFIHRSLVGSQCLPCSQGEQWRPGPRRGQQQAFLAAHAPTATTKSTNIFVMLGKRQRAGRSTEEQCELH
jgi:hypothetical protein